MKKLTRVLGVRSDGSTVEADVMAGSPYGAMYRLLINRPEYCAARTLDGHRELTRTALATGGRLRKIHRQSRQ